MRADETRHHEGDWCVLAADHVLKENPAFPRDEGNRRSGVGEAGWANLARLFFDAVCKFFDDRIGQDVAGDAFNLGAGGLLIKAICQ